MAVEETQGASSWTAAETETATAPEAGAAEVKAAPETTQQPQGKTYTDADVAAIKEQIRKETELRLRHEVTAAHQSAKAREERATAIEQTIQSRLDEQELLMARLLDRNEGNDLPVEQPQSYTARILAQRQARTAAVQPKQPSGEPTDEAYLTIKALATAAGIGMDDAKLDYVRYQYSQGKAISAVDEAKKLLGTVTAQPKETAEQERARMKAELKAEISREMGLDSVDTSSFAGSAGKRIYTMTELEDRSFVRQNWKDIQQAEKEGRIKE